MQGISTNSAPANRSLYQPATPRAFGQQFLDASHLRQAQGRTHLVQAIVVAQTGVVEPGVEDVAALVAQRAEQLRPVLATGDDHPALAGGDLLVRIEGEHRGIAQRASLPILISGADGFAGVLDHRQAMPVGSGEERVHIGGLAESMDGEKGLRIAGDRWQITDGRRQPARAAVPPRHRSFAA